MQQLVKVRDKNRLSLEEVFAISGKHAGFVPKFKGEIFIDFIDKRTGKLKKHKHIKNTRTWWWRNIIQNEQTINNTGYIFIANDDGDWHVHKTVARCLYGNNGGNFFTATPTISVSPSTYIYQYIAQFNAAPAGTVKTINAVGICGPGQQNHIGDSYLTHHVIAATKLSGAGETQDEYTIVNITYKLTCTV